MNRRTGIALMALSLATVSNAQSWDLANDFSVASNPNGDWSYGSTSSLGSMSAFNSGTVVEQHYITDGHPNIKGWCNGPSFHFPEAAKNFGASTVYQTWAPGQVVLQGNTGGSYAVARWTNPSAGSFSVAASFRRVENITQNVSQYWVLVNGNVQTTGTLLTLNQTATYSNAYGLNAGDTLDLVVGQVNISDGADLQVSAQINSVPEPCSMIALGTGALWLIRRRKR